MFEGFVAPIIKNVLGDYIQDLEKTKLNYSLWKGDIVLHNLKVRKDALRRFHLPFDVTEGRVKDFYMQIPWNELKNKPVKITINGVYLVADAASTILSEDDLEQEFIWKLEALSTAELFLERRLKKSNEDNSRFLERLVTKMVDNVQLRISDIHISYTDVLCDKQSPYVLDLSLKELSAVSTDEDYQPKFIDEQLSCIYKLVKMDKLEAVWGPRSVKQGDKYEPYVADKKRVVGPVSATAKIMAAKPNGSADPTNRVLLEFDHVELNLDNNQYLSAISQFETLQTRYKRERYSQFRPPEGSTPMKDPLLWFKFAVNCILSDIRKKTEGRTIDDFVNRIKDQREYMNVYLKHRQGTATEETSGIMNKLERKLSYEDLVLYRSMVISFMERENLKTGAREQQEGWSIRGAISSLWWRSNSDDQVQLQSEDDAMKALFDTVNYDPNAEDAAQYTIRSAKLELEFKLNTAVLKIKYFPEGEMLSRKTLVSLRVDNLNTHIVSYSGVVTGSFIIGNVVLENAQNPNSAFSVLVGSNSEKVSQLEEEDVFFKIMFEGINKDKLNKNSVKVEIFPLNIVVDIKTIKMIAEFFRVYMGGADALSIKNAAKDKIMNITHSTKTALINVLKERKIVNLKLDFYAPVLIIPENIDNLNSSGIVLDLGRFILETDNSSNEKARARLDEYLHGKSSSKEEGFLDRSVIDEARRIDEALVEVMYEDFKCTVTDVDVSVVKLNQIVNESGEIELSKKDINNFYKYQSAIKCSTINIFIGWRIIDGITELPKMKVNAECPLLNFQLSDYHFKRAYDVLLIALEPFGSTDAPIVIEKKHNRYGSIFKKIVSEPALLKIDNTLEVDGDLFYEASENANISSSEALNPSNDSLSHALEIFMSVNVLIHTVSASLIQSSMSDTDDDIIFSRIFNAEISNLSMSIRDFNKEFETCLGIDNITLLDAMSNNVISGNSENKQEGQVIEITYKYIKPGYDILTKYITSNIYVFMGNFSVRLSDEVIKNMRGFLTSLTERTDLKSINLVPKSSAAKLDSTVDHLKSKVNFRMKRVYVTVTYLNQPITTFMLGSLSTSAILLGVNYKVECLVGSITMSNDNPDASSELSHAYKNLFELTGSEVAKLTVIRSEHDDSLLHDNSTLSINIDICSSNITYEEKVFSLLYEFYKNFIANNYINDTARQVAINSAHSMTDSTSKLHLDVMVKSTTITIPKFAYYPTHGAVALLSDVRITSKYEVDEANSKYNHIVASIGNSSLNLLKFEGVDMKKKLIDIVSVQSLDLEIYLPAERTTSDTKISLNLTPFKLILDVEYIEQLISAYNALTCKEGDIDQKLNVMPVDTIQSEKCKVTNQSELQQNALYSNRTLFERAYDITLNCSDICFILSTSHRNNDKMEFLQFQVTLTKLKGNILYNDNGFNAMASVNSMILHENLSPSEPLWRMVFNFNSGLDELLVFKYKRDISCQIETSLYINTLSVLIHNGIVSSFAFLLKLYSGLVNKENAIAKEKQIRTSVHKTKNNFSFDFNNLKIYVAQNIKQDVNDFLIFGFHRLLIECGDNINVKLKHASLSVGSGKIDEDNVFPLFKNECIALDCVTATLEDSLEQQVSNVSVTQIVVRLAQNDIIFFMDMIKSIRMIKFDTSEENNSSEMNYKSITPSTKTSSISIKCNCCIDKVTFTFIGDAAEQNVRKYLINLLDIRITAELSEEIKINICTALSSSFFNLYNTRWEPIVERCNWNINIVSFTAQNGTSKRTTDVLLESKSVELDMSYSFIKSVLETLEHAKKGLNSNKLLERNSTIRYIVYNFTGIDMIIFSETMITKNSNSGNQNNSSCEKSSSVNITDRLVKVAHKGSAEFSLPIWREPVADSNPINNTLDISFEGMPLETLRGVSLDASQQKIYTLKPAIDNTRHKIFCDTLVKGNTKHFKFWSGMRIKNSTDFTINIRVVFTKSPNSFTKMHQLMELVEPNSVFNVPIAAAYYGSFYLQPIIPNTNYQNTLMFRSWNELISPSRKIEAYSVPNTDNTRILYFSLLINPTEMDTSIHAHPFVDITIRSPLTIDNLLPYKISYKILNERNCELTGGTVESGSSGDVYYICSKNLINLWISIHSPVGFKSVSGLTIETAIDDGKIKKLPVYDEENQALYLFVRYTDTRIEIYCPYVILNKTGLSLQYRILHLTSHPELLAGQVRGTRSIASEQKSSDPFMFSSKNLEEVKSRLEFKTFDTHWDGVTDLQIVGTPSVLSLQTETGREVVKLSVYISENAKKCPYTKLIHVEPYIYLKNICGRTLKLICGIGKSKIRINNGETFPLLYLHGDDKECYRLSATFDGDNHKYSNFLNMINLGPVYLKVPYNNDSRFEILFVNVALVGSSMHIVFINVQETCPYLFENMTEVDFYINQDGCKTRYKIPSNGKLPFIWDEPASTSKLIVISTENKVIMKTDLFKMGTLETFKLNTPSHTIVDVAVVSEALRSYTSILIAEKRKAFNTLSSYKKNCTNLSSRELAHYADLQSDSTSTDTLFNLSLLVSHLGISVINKSVEELLYVSSEDLFVGYAITPKFKYYEFGIGWLQIDDQSSIVLDQILLYPTSTLKNEDGQKSRFLSLSASGCVDSMFGVNYFYDFNFLMQEITVTLDEALLVDIISFVSLFNSSGDDNSSPFTLSVEPRNYKSEAPQELRIYFKEFLIQPMKINLSLVKVREIDDMSLLVNSLTKYAFGNIHDAIVIFKALELKNARIKSLNEFFELIETYYKKQFINQIYRLVGFADILGSPVGLFNNICSGMSDFFYEPLHGFELARPHYIGTHVAKGTASLVKNTVFGLTNTITKISSSIGEGLSAITFDDSYQKRRHATRVRNRPKHAVHGVTRGAKAFATSVASGVKDIVAKPLKGAHSKGFEGFINGLGMGIVGAVTKPVVGVIDMATHFGEEPLLNANSLTNNQNYHQECEGKIIIVTNTDIIKAKNKTFAVIFRVAFDDIERISQVGSTMQIFTIKGSSPITVKLSSVCLVKKVCAEAQNAHKRYCDKVLDCDL